MSTSDKRVQQRKRPVQQRSQATVGFIVEAAAQVFGERGYRAATTNHIAERAGVSIGSLYQYFPSKDALLVALAEQHLQDAAAHLGAAAERLRREQPALRPLVERLVEAVVTLHREHPLMHTVLYRQVPRTPDLLGQVSALEDAMAVEVEHHLRRVHAGGDDPTLAAHTVVRMVEALVHELVLEPPAGRSPEACQAAVVAAVVGYLSLTP